MVHKINLCENFESRYYETKFPNKSLFKALPKHIIIMLKWFLDLFFFQHHRKLQKLKKNKNKNKLIPLTLLYPGFCTSSEEEALGMEVTPNRRSKIIMLNKK